jgi:O-antigen/teichoic acid export membrane protein
MLTKPESVPSLRNRILRAGTWTLGGYGTSQAIRLASNLIMTRLLVPEVFGVMAIAIVVQVGVSMMSDVGLGQAVVQNRRGTEPKFLDTIWTAQIIRGAVVAGFTALVGLLIWQLNRSDMVDATSVYASPGLPLVIAGVGATSIIVGLVSTNMALANRTLSLGRVTAIEIASQLAGIGSMLIFAYFERSVWALVFGGWTAAFIKVGLSHTLLSGNPNRIRWDDESWSEIHSFGRWIFLSSALGFLSANLDRILVAAYMPSREFALFTIAALLIGAARDVVSRIYTKICFPAFSEVVRDRPHDLSDVYYKFRLPIDALCLFLCGFFFVGGGAIIRLLYDARYEGAGYILQLLSLSLIPLRYGGLGMCYMATGQPKIITVFTITRLAGVATLIPVANWLWGIDGVLIAIPLTYFVTLPLVAYFSIRLGFASFVQEIAAFPVVLLGAFAGQGLNLLVQTNFSGIP